MFAETRPTMKVLKNKDVLGMEIRAGDYIVYGASKGRCAGLNIGLVVSTKMVRSDYDGMCLKVSAEAVQVSYGRYERTGMDSYSSNKKPRQVHLCYSERICVIPEAIVPQAIKDLLA